MIKKEIALPKKRGIIARILLFLVLPITAPFILLKALASGFVRFIREIRTTLPGNIKEIRSNIADAKIVMQDRQLKFDVILRRWGITEDEIIPKTREAYFHAACWGGASIMAFGAMCMHQNYLSLIIFSCFIVTILGALTSLWKAEVLKERQYIHFFDWLRFWN